MRYLNHPLMFPGFSLKTGSGGYSGEVHRSGCRRCKTAKVVESLRQKDGADIYLFVKVCIFLSLRSY